MSDEQAKRPIPITVTAIIGSSESDDGQLVKVGLKTASSQTADLLMSPERVVDLIALSAGAAGQAA